MSMLIFRDIVDVGEGPHDWRVMMVGDEFVCTLDDQTLRTRDRDEAARFLTNEAHKNKEVALARAYRFLSAVAPLQFSVIPQEPA